MARPGAETAINGKPSRDGLAAARPSERLLDELRSAERVVFVSHVQPDPDSLGSMLGLAHLVERTLRRPVLITRDGLINRAENRAMVDVLHLDLVPVEHVRWSRADGVVMVDSQPKTGRHSLPEGVPFRAVVDHHLTPGQLTAIPFLDIRPGLGATCTIVTQYLREQRVDIPEKVATALIYGVETEVTGYPREATVEDDEALDYLYPLADKDLLAQIRNARLPHSHFESMHQAMRGAQVHDRLVLTWVHDLAQPEHAAEVVDFLIRYESVDWAVCVGRHRDQLVLSMRSAKPHARAGEILRGVVGDLGQAGGHERRAGGSVPLRGRAEHEIAEIRSELRSRFLSALGIGDAGGHPLVASRELASHPTY